MGVAVSSWNLARAVAREGGLGVVSGTALDVVVARRLQFGDLDGSVRRALAHFPCKETAAKVLDTWYVPGGKEPSASFPHQPLGAVPLDLDRQVLIVVSNFVEVWLAREGHDGKVGINYLEKIQLPLLPSLYGAMLAGVDVVLMGAGIPVGVPGVLAGLSRLEPVHQKLSVAGAERGVDYLQHFDPREALPSLTEPVAVPLFVPIVSAHAVAKTMLRRANGTVDGFVIEKHEAGGHNAPPRRGGGGDFGERDVPNLEAFAALGVPFWLGGSVASPDHLRTALDAGAAGIQVGSAFALCEESGLRPDIREGILARYRAGTLEVLTDFKASPTGYPFKVVTLPETVADPDVYAARRRVCDLGFLREAYAVDGTKVGFRCPAETPAAYAAKGGDADSTEGRKCLCNGLLATVGLGQMRKGAQEPPIVTAGEDLSFVDVLTGGGEHPYTAADVLRYLRSGD